jgi:hypothetical protein
MGTMKNTVIRPVPPDSAEAAQGHTYLVTCTLCGTTVYGDSVRFFAGWIKAHRCPPSTTLASP